MRLFLKKVSVIIVLLLFVIVLVDNWLRHANTTTYVKYNGLLQVKDSVDVIVLGNSHACYAVDPSCFSQMYVYNLANFSQNIILDAGILYKAMEYELPNLKYVLISIDHHSLYQESDDGVSPMKAYYSSGVKLDNRNNLYYLLADISPVIFGYKLQIAELLIRRSIIRYTTGEDNTIVDMESNINMNEVDRGFATFYKIDEHSFNTNSYKSRASGMSGHDTFNVEVIEHLETLITWLLEKGIVPILFTSPTYYEYNAFLSEDQRRQTKQEIDRLCIEYNIQYLGYEQDDMFVLEDFYNCDHLNYIGTEKFSQILADTLQF